MRIDELKAWRMVNENVGGSEEKEEKRKNSFC